MQISYFQPLPYLGDELLTGWPQPPGRFRPDVAVASMRQHVDAVRWADDAGLDYISVAEHHYASRQMSPNPLVAAAYLAPIVRSAKIAVLGCNLAINNPVRLAEEISMLDVMLDGRLLVGLLKGTPNEYATYGTNPDEAREIFEEGLALIRRAWTEDFPFAWEGRHHQFRTVACWPRPLRGAGTPILVPGTSERSARFAAEHGYLLGMAFTSYEKTKDIVELYSAVRTEFGVPAREEDVLWRDFIYVAQSDARAREEVEPYTFGNLGGITRGEFGGGPGRLPPICGSPETVVAQLHDLREIGVGIAELIFGSDGLPKELHDKSFSLFVDEVLPHVR